MLTEKPRPFRRCFINGKNCAVGLLSDGRAVLFNSLKDYNNDALKLEMNVAGLSFRKFPNVWPLPSADYTGILSVIPGATIDWEGSPEYNARVAAARSVQGGKECKLEVHTSETHRRETFQTPCVDTVPGLADLCKLLGGNILTEIEAWGFAVGAATLKDQECPMPPKSLDVYMILPGLPKYLDTYKLKIQREARKYATKILENRKETAECKQKTKNDANKTSNQSFRKNEFHLKRLEELYAKINNFTKEDEDHYYDEFLKLNALRIDNISEETLKENERDRVSYCPLLKDAYNEICEELKCFNYWGNPMLFRFYSNIHSNCSPIYFSQQILNYYIACIEGRRFEDIYTREITFDITKTKLSDVDLDSLVSYGIPSIANREINIICYLGSLYYYCTNTNINKILCDEINRIASNIRNLRSGTYKSLLLSGIENAERIESEALLLLAYSKKLLQNEQYTSKIEERNQDYKNYKTGNRESILRFLELVLEDSTYPFTFKKHIELDFAEDGTLVLEYRLPALADVPNLYYKELKRDNEWVKLPTSKLNACYDDIICAIALRTIGEIFTFDSMNYVKDIGFNGFIQSHSPATGIIEKKCILSLLVNRDTFFSLNLSHVEPKECVKYLKGVFASKIHTGTPIQPIITISKDSRIVANKDVEYNPLTNLAEMDWEDFEHLVRQIFEWEFKDSGGEVNVTQASRDGGVDAIIFDPDPIRGGKIVVQAKRYTNTVGVSAVRDIYGTIINEGANKGILITTSDYGPDAYKFATGKPITLLNGGHLLYLLEKHGKKARIDIKEAKENMGNGKD